MFSAAHYEIDMELIFRNLSFGAVLIPKAFKKGLVLVPILWRQLNARVKVMSRPQKIA